MQLASAALEAFTRFRIWGLGFRVLGFRVLVFGGWDVDRGLGFRMNSVGLGMRGTCFLRFYGLTMNEGYGVLSGSYTALCCMFQACMQHFGFGLRTRIEGQEFMGKGLGVGPKYFWICSLA